MNDLVFLTAGQLAEAIRRRDVSASEVLEAHLAQIAKHNPALNAIVTLDEENARRRAQEADAALARGEVWGPLHGVPFTAKDAFETAGVRTTSSYKPLADYVPRQNATVVARLLDAGGVLLGKTNMPELAGDAQSHSPLFGRANNPWGLDRTPSGSTGGGAAAVAAGLSPLEIGSDLAGSIRNPAHACGVFGLKPTEHLVSGAGHIPDLPGSPKATRHLGTFGPLARSVQDLRLALSLIAGPDGRDWEVPPAPLAEPPARTLEQLRFAWTDDFRVPVTADTRAALEGLAGDLAQAGCRVERAKPPGLDLAEAWRTFGQILGAQVAAALPLPLRALRHPLSYLAPLAFSPRDPIPRAILRGFRLGVRGLVEALTRRDALIATLEAFLIQWDAWLCPVASTPAFTHRKPATTLIGQPIEVDGQRVPYWVVANSFTTVFNLTGNPVVVLPLALSRDGLPIGVQVVGRRWRDMELLAVATRLAEAFAPFRRPPGY